MAITESTTMAGAQRCVASGKSGKLKRRNPYPHFEKDPGQDHGARSRSLDVGIRKPGMERPHRDLDCEGEKEGEERPELEGRTVGALGEFQDIQCADAGLLEVLLVERDDPHQH